MQMHLDVSHTIPHHAMPCCTMQVPMWCAALRCDDTLGIYLSIYPFICPSIHPGRQAGRRAGGQTSRQV